MFKKFSVMVSVIALVFSLFAPMTSHASEKEEIDWKDYYGNELTEEQFQLANEISNYFTSDKNGRISFTANKETLIEMGISESDAELMVSASVELPRLSQLPEVSDTEFKPMGFVGIYINLGPKVRGMTGWAAGAFAGGYVGWYAKNFAVNPVTAGVASLITATTVLVVKNAVENGVKRVPIGHNIPGWTLSYTVNIP